MRFGTAFASEGDAMLRFCCGAAMWKITTRGFTLEEVLIMAAMNLLASGDRTSKRETHERSRGQKETRHATEVLDKTRRTSYRHSCLHIHHRIRAAEPLKSYDQGHG